MLNHNPLAASVRGERYEAPVPDTLDLADRMGLTVNALRGNLFKLHGVSRHPILPCRATHPENPQILQILILTIPRTRHQLLTATTALDCWTAPALPATNGRAIVSLWQTLSSTRLPPRPPLRARAPRSLPWALRQARKRRVTSCHIGVTSCHIRVYPCHVRVIPT